MKSQIVLLILSISVNVGSSCCASDDKSLNINEIINETTQNGNSQRSNKNQENEVLQQMPSRNNQDVIMTFVLGTDRNYILPTLVTIYSLLNKGIPDVNSRGRKIQIIILSDRLTERHMNDIQQAIQTVAESLKYSQPLTIHFLPTNDLENNANGVKFNGRNLSEKDNTKGEKIRGYMQTMKVAFHKM